MRNDKRGSSGFEAVELHTYFRVVEAVKASSGMHPFATPSPKLLLVKVLVAFTAAGCRLLSDVETPLMSKPLWLVRAKAPEIAANILAVLPR
jgi:hypothetical protein